MQVNLSLENSKQNKREKKRAIFKNEMKNNWIAYLMALPGIIFIFAFSSVPMAFITLAFQKYNVRTGFFHSPWVGFQNFIDIFSLGSKLWQVVFNTLYLNIWFIVTSTFMAILVAILVNEIKNKMFKRITQSIFFFPYFLSWVVVSAILYAMLNTDYGSINTALGLVGIDKVRWYAEPKYWRTILVLTNIWKGTGYGSIIYLGAISGFDISCYESAYVDGASKFQRILYLTLPMLKPTVVILVLMAVGGIFYGNFGMIYAIVGDVGPLLSKVDVIDSYVFRALRTNATFSTPAAAGLCQSIMGMFTILLCNHLAKKINDGTALF